MRNNSHHEQADRQKGIVPFVCLFTPSVCHKRSCNDPYIRCFRPFVCFYGFTLVELLITLIVAGILAAVAVPGFQQFVASNQLTTSTNDLIADLALSRSEAIRRARAIVVCASSNGTGCTTSTTFASGWIIFVDSDNNGAVSTGEEIIRRHEALKGVATVTGSVTSLTYSRGGYSAASAQVQIGLCHSRIRKSRTISIETTGRSSLSQGTC